MKRILEKIYKLIGHTLCILLYRGMSDMAGSITHCLFLLYKAATKTRFCVTAYQIQIIVARFYIHHISLWCIVRYCWYSGHLFCISCRLFICSRCWLQSICLDLPNPTCFLFSRVSTYLQVHLNVHWHKNVS